MTNTKIYNCWGNMKDRCLNPSNVVYSSYGGRGIGVCDKWCTFIGFYEDIAPLWVKFLLDNPGKVPSIDRIDNDGNYELQNVQIVSLSQNSKKQRSNKVVMYSTDNINWKYCNSTRDLSKITGINRRSIMNFLNGYYVKNGIKTYYDVDNIYEKYGFYLKYRDKE